MSQREVFALLRKVYLKRKQSLPTMTPAPSERSEARQQAATEAALSGRPKTGLEGKPDHAEKDGLSFPKHAARKSAERGPDGSSFVAVFGRFR